MIPLEYYLLLGLALFCIGAYGVITLRNGIRLLMCIEIMLNGANVNFIAFSSYAPTESPQGQVFGLFSIAIAAAEAAVGLAIMIAIYRVFRSVDMEDINLLKW